MRNHDHVKTRIAGEISKVLFGDEHVPDAAWRTIDGIVDAAFDDWTDERLVAILDDIGQVRACFEDCDPRDLEGPSGVSKDMDWLILAAAIHDCQETLGCPRQSFRHLAEADIRDDDLRDGPTVDDSDEWGVSDDDFCDGLSDVA